MAYSKIRKGLSGLGKIQKKCLTAFVEASEPLTINAVNELIRDEMYITEKSVKALHARGLISKKRDPSYPRIQYLYSLTDYGQNLLSGV